MIRLMTFELALPLSPSLNEIIKWSRFKRARQKIIMRDLLQRQIMQQSLTQARGAHFDCVSFTRYSVSALDYDNFVGGCKHILDVIKEMKLIADDSEGHIDTSYTQVRSKREQARLVIQLSKSED